MRDSIHLKRAAAVVLVAAVALLAGCSRDPNVTKKRYLESGNRYFAKGKYKEARIMYLDALQKDQRFGEAYYRLGLTALKTGPLMDAVNALRRAVELLPKDSTERRDAMVTLADVYVMAAREQKSVLDEVEGFCHELLSRDPNSFDGHRLTGDLDMARSAIAFSSSNKEEGQKLLTLALEEYTKANSVKPESDGVLLQMARANASLGHQDASEQLYKQLTQRTKTLQVAYSELYRLYV